MREIGLNDIEDIALGATLLGAGGGGFLLFYCDERHQKRLRSALSDLVELPFSLETLQGGLKDNAIPREAGCTILLPDASDKSELERLVSSWQEVLKHEYRSSDPKVSVQCTEMEQKQTEVLDASSLTKVLFFLRTMPWGVQHMSPELEGLVETSLNPGLLRMTDEKIKIGISVRSSVDSAKDALVGKLRSLANLAGAGTEVTGDYPGWTYRKESPLRDKMVEVYREMYHKEPVVEAIHAGVECGLLAHKIPGLDCVSIGPDMKDIHTAKEKLSIPSVERMWEYLLKVLEAL